MTSDSAHRGTASWVVLPALFAAIFEELTPAGGEWVVATWGDADHQTLRRARNPFTHGTMRMDATVTLGRPTPALFFFHVGPNREPVESGQLVSMAFTLVDRRLGAFMSELQAGQLFSGEA